MQQSFAITRNAQTISFTSAAPAGATVGGAHYTATATSDSGLAVALTVDAASTAVCTISSGDVSFQAAGGCTIDANQAGNTTYAPAAQAQQTFTVAQGSQTITFTSTAPANATVAGATYHPTASSSAGLATSLSIDAASASVCALSGGVVSFTASGTCIIDANQAGDGNYTAAPQAQQSFSVLGAAQTVSFTSTAPAAATFGGGSYTPTATATSGLTVTLTIDAASAGVCAISGGTVSYSGAGTCTIDANQAGNSTYRAASQVQQSFTVAAATQTVSFTSTAPSNAVLGGSTYTPTATSTSGLTVTITVDPTEHQHLHDLRRHRQLPGRRHLHHRRQPGRQQQLQPRTPNPTELHRLPRPAGNHLHLDGAGKRSDRRRLLHADRDLERRPHRHPDDRLLERRHLQPERRQRQLPGRGHMHDRRQPARQHHL